MAANMQMGFAFANIPTIHRFGGCRECVFLESQLGSSCDGHNFWVSHGLGHFCCVRPGSCLIIGRTVFGLSTCCGEMFHFDLFEGYGVVDLSELVEDKVTIDEFCDQSETIADESAEFVEQKTDLSGQLLDYSNIHL